MGHWSQRQLRGGGGVAPSPSFPFAAPGPAEWTLQDDGGGVWDAFINSAPIGVSFFNAQDQINGGGWNDQGAAGILLPIQGADGAPGDTVEVQVRWWDNGASQPLSDWSATKTLILA